jgi:hypothetical protein
MSANNNPAPRCKLCGNEMYMTRFQSDVSVKGIDRNYYYECLWCGENDTIEIQAIPNQSVEHASA